MGEYSDMILNGDMCQICGMYMKDGKGYPRLCSDCDDNQDDSKRTYIGFTRSQRHRINGKYLDFRCIAVIKCEDKQHGRKLAFKYFSTQFDFEYHDTEFKSCEHNYPRGFVYIN